MGRPPFTALARAYAASIGGDAFVAVALAGSLFFMVPSGEARPKVALYLLLTMSPFALVAPVLGPALDRAKTKRATLATAACVLRGVLCVLMARHLHSPAPATRAARPRAAAKRLVEEIRERRAFAEEIG